VATGVLSALGEATVRGVMDWASSGLVSASIDPLVKKALRTMMMEKIRFIACAWLSVAVLSVGANALVGREPRDDFSKAPASGGLAIQSPSDPDERLLAKADLDLTHGLWTRVSTENQGKMTLYDDTPSMRSGGLSRSCGCNVSGISLLLSRPYFSSFPLLVHAGCHIGAMAFFPV
jgi:hypothetical protein